MNTSLICSNLVNFGILDIQHVENQKLRLIIFLIQAFETK